MGGVLVDLRIELHKCVKVYRSTWLTVCIMECWFTADDGLYDSCVETSIVPEIDLVLDD